MSQFRGVSCLLLFLTLCLPMMSYAAYFSGEIKVTVFDDFIHKKSKTVYILKTAETSYELKLKPNVSIEDILTGDKVSVEGHVVKTADIVQRIRVAAIKRINEENQPFNAAENRTVGIFIVNFTDLQASVSVDEIMANMYTNSNSIKDYFLTSSFGKENFIGDLNGDGDPNIHIINLDFGAGQSCDTNRWSEAVFAKASEQGLDVSLYRHRIFFVPHQVNCNWSGTASYGCKGHCNAWSKSDSLLVLAHELGHNLGMHHAATDWNNDGMVDDEYGDVSSAMGVHYRQMNAPHRYEAMNWYVNYPDMVKVMKGSGRVTINSLDKHPKNYNHGVQVVKVESDRGFMPYYLSYRTDVPPYGMTPVYAKKISIHRLEQRLTRSLLVGVLDSGQTFASPREGIKFKVLKTFNDTAKVRVFNKPACSFKKDPCLFEADETITQLKGKNNYLAIDVPENTSLLSINTVATEVNPLTQLWVRYGKLPSKKVFDCKSQLDTNQQVCEITNPQAGTWYIKLSSTSSHEAISVNAQVN